MKEIINDIGGVVYACGSANNIASRSSAYSVRSIRKTYRTDGLYLSVLNFDNSGENPSAENTRMYVDVHYARLVHEKYYTNTT